MKKSILRTLLASALCLPLFATSGCSSDDDGPAPEVSPSTNSVTIPASGEARTVDIRTNQSEWTATRPDADAWCLLTPEGGKLTISANENKDLAPRSTTVTIQAGRGKADATIRVTQSAADPVIRVEPTSVELDTKGTAVEVSVTTNLKEWTASCPDQWCTPTRSGDKLSIAGELFLGDERTATVTIDAGSGVSARSATVTVVQKGSKPTIEIAVPSDFSECSVQKATYNGEKIAEICLEYIRSGETDKQMTVIYPMADSKADLTKGIEISTGGTVVWNKEENTCTYTPGSATAPQTKFYLEPDGTLAGSTRSDILVQAVIHPDVLVDVRGASSETYRIVKIGTQYWMAENLRAERFADGSTIPTDWEGEEGSYKYLYNSPSENKQTLGALYSGYAVVNKAGLAPAGWLVPDNAAWTRLKAYIGASGAGTKLKSKDYWQTNPGTNASGFDARPAYSYSPATDFLDSTVETWFWSSTTASDFGQPALNYVRLTDRGTGMTFTDGLTIHALRFGHSVRCVME